MTVQAPADWHPDPAGRHELRYWDGGRWTEHVASRGRQGIDHLVGGPPVPTIPRENKSIQRQVRSSGVTSSAPDVLGTILTESVLVVNQKAKLFEVKAEYAVYDQHGRQIGAVREIGQNFLRKALAVRADSDRARRLQIVDMTGQVVIALTRPAKLLKSKVIVMGANGSLIGHIVQKNLGFLGKVNFRIEAHGKQLGSINAESYNEWDFSIQDTTGNEIARITRTWAGMAKEMFTKGDNYVVQIHEPLEEPLRSLVVAAALAVDTALRQDNN